jgi:5-methylcytosine-specific restriction endonuclease McrA
MEDRKCHDCHVSLPIENFGDTETKQYKTCIKCRTKCAEYRKKNREKLIEYNRNYYLKNREKFLEEVKKYREVNKDKLSKKQKEHRIKNHERFLEKDREYYKNNKEKCNERSRKYQAANKEEIQKTKRAYYEKNREAILEKDKIYSSTPKGRAVAQNANIKRRGYFDKDDITKEDWLAVMWLCEWKCFYCNVDLTADNRTLDHLIPLSRGGKHEVGNLLPSCISCNSSKLNKQVEAWYKFGSLSPEKQAVILSMLAKYKQ